MGRTEAIADGEARHVLEVATLAVGRGLPSQVRWAVPGNAWCSYVGEEHELGEWLAGCPSDTVWAFKPSFEMMCRLWFNACFTLPSPGSPITTCPNPMNRYCVDLTRRAPWLQSKKVRRHKADFRLVVNGDYKRTFWDVKKTHERNNKGVWITSELVDALDRCRCLNGDIKVYAIELIEKSSGKVAAVIMSFSIGDIFHDYSTVTMIVDKRSTGAILTKAVGHLLVGCGYTTWYWGFKNPYMAEYDGSYGGEEMSNPDFWLKWKRAQALARSSPLTVPDLASCVPAGGLDLATL
eukprot:NODE_2199_length_978_cov_191.244854.p1 GENE.NODE_2199_length_978_cov_191.244854~~NODE_2199_length_978_cov_191.244854.p1  ORF type:complete len:294 (-),score=75.75 NODE_2199_length_978_cov_191.244854:79-960(-)